MEKQLYTDQLIDQRHQDFYLHLREKITGWLQGDNGENKWAPYIMLVPDMFHLLCKLVVDPKVSSKDKTKLAAVIVYFISPIDLVPEGIVGPMGYLDDIALTAYALNAIINNTAPEIIQKHWAGQDNILEVIRNVLATADEMLGSGLWDNLKTYFNKGKE